MHKFVFFANPRTGSTTIRDVLDPHSDILSVNIKETTSEFPFFHHISAKELKNIFYERSWNWNEYTKFTVIRNPYDRVVSLWHHRQWMVEQKRNAEPIDTFESYVDQININARLTTSLSNFISDDNGNELVDRILKFENLEEELKDFLKIFDIPTESLVIPKLNSSKKRDDYKKYYNEKTFEKVTKLYEDEIKRFSYTF